MAGLFNKLGFSPELRAETKIKDKAMAGDLVFVVTPATLATAATAGFS